MFTHLSAGRRGWGQGQVPSEGANILVYCPSLMAAVPGTPLCTTQRPGKDQAHFLGGLRMVPLRTLSSEPTQRELAPTTKPKGWLRGSGVLPRLSFAARGGPGTSAGSKSMRDASRTVND